VRPFSVPMHHGEPADPTLLEWIRVRIEELVSFGPLTIVLLIGAVIVALPVGLLIWYWLSKRRATGSQP